MKFRSNPIQARVLESHRPSRVLIVTVSRTEDLSGAHPTSERWDPKGGVGH